MNITKIIGWLVFLFGISIMVFTIYNTYNIFTGESPAPQIIAFNIENSKTPTEGGVLTGQDQITQMISQQLGNLLPLDSLPLILNLIVWTIGAGVLIFGGAQISGLGIKLMKNG